MCWRCGVSLMTWPRSFTNMLSRYFYFGHINSIMWANLAFKNNLFYLVLSEPDLACQHGLWSWKVSGLRSRSLHRSRLKGHWRSTDWGLGTLPRGLQKNKLQFQACNKVCEWSEQGVSKFKFKKNPHNQVTTLSLFLAFRIPLSVRNYIYK